MNKSLKERLHICIKAHLAHDREGCRDALQSADEDIKLLGRQGISLTSLEATTAAKDFGLHPLAWLDCLESLEESLKADQRLDNSAPAAINSETSDGSLYRDVHSWFPDTESKLECAEALYEVRRWLALSSKQEGFKGILSDVQLMQKLRHWLQYVPCVEIAGHPKSALCADTNLLSLLPAAVRAWLLADIAAGLLLAEVQNRFDSERLRLPDTPQHHAAFQLLFSRAFAGHPEDARYEAQVADMHEQEMQQAFADKVQAWERFQQLCSAALAQKSNSSLKSSTHSAANGDALHHEWQVAEKQQMSPAAVMLAGLQGILEESAGHTHRTPHQHHQQNVYLPGQVAAVLADEIRGASSSSSSSWGCLHASLCSICTALLAQLRSEGARLGLHPDFINRQHVQLQSALLHMLAPVQQEAAAGELHTQQQPPADNAGDQLEASSGTQTSTSLKLVEAVTNSTDDSVHTSFNGVQRSGEQAAHLDPAQLAPVVNQVVKFVQAVHAARNQQQKEVLLQLQRQLKALYDAVQHQGNASNSRNATAVAAVASTKSAVTQSLQDIDPLDIAELVGLGNLGLLLQLDYQQQQVADSTDALCALLSRTGHGHHLMDFQGTEGLVTCQDPGCLLMYYRARAAASELIGSCQQPQQQQWGASPFGSGCPWHMQQLQLLLVTHGGLSLKDSQEFVESCSDLHGLLRLCAISSAAAACKVPMQQVPVLVRSTEDYSSSGAENTSRSGADSKPSVIPGFKVSLAPVYHQPLEQMSGGLHKQLGLLGRYGLCNLLMRMALSHQAGQQLQQQQEDEQLSSNLPSSAAAVGGGKIKVNRSLLRRRLLDRLKTLKHLAALLQPITLLQWQLPQQCWEPRAQVIVHQLIGAALPGDDAAAVLRKLSKADEQHKHLTESIVQCLQGSGDLPATFASSSSSSSSDPDVERGSGDTRLTKVVIATVSTFRTRCLLMDCFGNIAKDTERLQLLLQHCCVWGPAASSYSSSSSAMGHAPDTTSLQQQQQQQPPSCSSQVEGWDIGRGSSNLELGSGEIQAEAVLLMLSALETLFCRHLHATLTAAVSSRQSAVQVLEHSNKMAQLCEGFLPHKENSSSSSGDAALKRLYSHHSEAVLFEQRFDQMQTMLQPLSQAYGAWEAATLRLRKLVTAASGLILEAFLWSEGQPLLRMQQQQQCQLQWTKEEQLLEEIRVRADHLVTVSVLAACKHTQSGDQETRRQAELRAAVSGLTGLLHQKQEQGDQVQAYLQRINQKDSVRLLLHKGAEDRHEVVTAAAQYCVAAALGLLAGLGAWSLPDCDLCGRPQLEDTTGVNVMGAAAIGGVAGCGQDGWPSNTPISAGGGVDGDDSGCQDLSLLGSHQPQRRQWLIDIAQELLAGSSSKSTVLELLTFISSTTNKQARELVMGLSQYTSCASSSSSSSSGMSRGAALSSMKGPGAVDSKRGPRCPEIIHDMQQALWQLLLALKPSYCRVMHMLTLPQQCRSSEAFEAAILGQPLQQLQQVSSTAGHYCTCSSSSSRVCHCGKPESECYKYRVVQETNIFSRKMQVSKSRVLCGHAGCVAKELHHLSQQGPPDGFFPDAQNCDPGLEHDGGMADIIRDLVLLKPDIRCLIDGGRGCPQAAQHLQQQRQWARAVQVSLCKSGSPAGLVRRLLLLEAIRHPAVKYSLLHPALLPAWQQQMMYELGNVAVPATATLQQQEQVQGARDRRDDQSSNISRTTSSSSMMSDAVSACSSTTAERNLLCHWNGHLWLSLLHHTYLREHCSGRDSDEQDIVSVYDVYCFGAASRCALCCWVMCWHCCVKEKGGAYHCAVTRAAAAEAASDMIGPDQLQHIRLAWADMLPPPTPSPPPQPAAAANVSTSNHHQPPVWWNEPLISNSSSTAGLSSSHCSNERWCHALHKAGGSACQGLCDHCGVSLTGVSSSRQQAGRSPAWCCPGCGVAVYCSRSCADKDHSNHKHMCRLLTEVSDAKGIKKAFCGLQAAGDTC